MDENQGNKKQEEVEKQPPSQGTSVEGEMSEDELAEVVGGLTTVVIPLCKHCQTRIAVHEMNVCAICYVKYYKPYSAPETPD